MPAIDPKSPLTIMGGSAIALLVIMFLPWYGASAGGFSVSATAWEVFSYTDLLLFLAAAGAIAAFVLTSQGHVQAGTVVQVVTGLAAFMTLIVLYRIVNQPGPNSFVSVKIGAFLGLIAIAGVAFGAFKTMTDGPSGSTPYVEPVR